MPIVERANHAERVGRKATGPFKRVAELPKLLERREISPILSVGENGVFF